MTPKPQERGWGRLTLAISAFWFVAGLFVSAWFRLMLTLEGKPAHWGWLSLFGEGFWDISALFTPILVRLDRSLSLERGRRLRSVLIHVPALLLFSAVHTVLRDQWNRAVSGRPILGDEFMTTLPRLLGTQLGGPIMIYTAVLAAVQGWGWYLRFQERTRAAAALEVERARLRASLSEARLEALQAQLQPHFLFNALHALSTLVLEGDRKSANEMISHLSRFLRMTLDNADAPTVPLSMELQFLDAYLAIQKARFGDRLRVSLEISEAAREAGVPNLVLQPLVENSIRHGIGSERGAGHVVVRATVSGDLLRLEVEDDGPGPQGAKPTGKGRGLGNVRERLEQLYPGAYEFGLTAVPTGGTLAAITVPFRPVFPDAGACPGGRRGEDS